MYRKLAYGLLCFFALSCTKTAIDCPSQDGDAIILTATAGPAKSIVSGTSLTEDYTIYTSAYYTNMTTGEEGDYFTAAPFRLAGDRWTAVPARYWPLGCKLDFLSIACEKDSLDIASCASWTEFNCTDGVEVNIPDGKCLSSEVLFASTRSRTSAGGSINMQFSHSQDWLRFNIGCEVEIVKVDSIVIRKVYTGGKLRITNNMFMDAEWSFRGHLRRDVTVPGSVDVIPHREASEICNILVPEQDACDIDIYYSVKSSLHEDWSRARSTVYRYKAGSTPWNLGSKQIIDIGFSFSEITITSTVKDWDDTSSDIIVEPSK